MIVSTCAKMGSTINALAEAGTIKPVFVEWQGVTHKANSLFAALDWLKSQGYYNPGIKDMAKFHFIQ